MTEISSTLRKRFSKQEDKILKHAVDEQGLQNWDEIAQFLPGRTGRQCRDRYNNYLFKEISGKPWSPEEDEIIRQKYQIYGSHWVKISQFLDGRSGNNVKNRWYKYLSKRDPSNVKITNEHKLQNISNEQEQKQNSNPKQANASGMYWDRTLNEEDLLFDLIQDSCDWNKEKQSCFHENWFY